MFLKQELANDRITYLIINAINGRLTQQELIELDEWRKEKAAHEALFNEISSESLSIHDQWQKSDSQLGFAKLQGRLKTEKKRRLYTIWSSAAAIVIILFTFGILLPRKNPETDAILFLAAKNITSARHGATLTVSGLKIDLSVNRSGLVVSEHGLGFEDGARLDQLKDTKILTKELIATTAKGFTYHLTLSDGTKVWLNANSSLKFPSTFLHASTREVRLEGEAYFQVKHISSQPFIVHTIRSTTKDIGTSFNIKDYPNDAMATSTLEEGSTLVWANITGKSESKQNGIILTPGHQASISQEKLNIAAVDLEEDLAWKNGYFRFNNQKLTEIMKNLSRWYDIDVEFEGKISDEGLYGTISRDKNLYEVLRMLEDTKEVKFLVKGRRVIVSTEK